jgi:hypothetical protein
MTRSTRESETRAHEQRDHYDMDYVSPLAIPRGVAKDGYSYAYVRKDIKGQDDFRVEDMAAKGWTPVPADRAPGYSFDPLNRNPLSKLYITYKDVLLMERPEEYSKRETQRFNEYNANRVRSLRGVSNDLGGFAKPLNSINSF